MKFFVTGIIISLCVFTFPVKAQENYLNFVGSLFFPGDYHSSGDTTGTSDVWGYTDEVGKDCHVL